MKARRKENAKHVFLAQQVGESKFSYYWRLCWVKLYSLVAILTYVLMLVGYSLVIYSVLVSHSLANLIGGVILALLSIHINKSNPH